MAPSKKKTRMGKKKRRLIEQHTLNHVRGGGHYPPSHERKIKIDPRVAGAGMLGARLKQPQHAGRIIGTQTAPVRITNSKYKRSHATQTMGNTVVHKGVQVGTEGPTRATTSTQTDQKPKKMEVEFMHAAMTRETQTDQPRAWMQVDKK